MATQALVSTVVMGLLVVTVFVAASRLQAMSAAPAEASLPDRYDGSRMAEWSERPDVLGAGFAVVVLLVGVVAIGAVGGLPISIGVDPFAAIMAIIGLVVAGFLFLGPYTVARRNGLGNAHGVAAGMGGLGFAFLALIVAQLLVGVV